MQIEAGKYYRTRDGRKVGPMSKWTSEGTWGSDQADIPLRGGLWNGDGSPLYPSNVDSPPLIAEWSEGPVRTETVTTRRIVPGVYGRLRVAKSSLTDEICVTIEAATKTYPHSPTPSLNATELDELAMVASQLAEALRDKPVPTEP